MPANPPENMPRITPYLLYQDVAKALDFLTRAFGFRERMRMPMPDGSIGHAEMELADGVIMLGCPGASYRNPKSLGGVTTNIYVYVDDVDKHFERAKGAGARILQEPADQFYGDRNAQLEDPSGHLWHLSTHKEDVSPEQMRQRLEALSKQQ